MTIKVEEEEEEGRDIDFDEGRHHDHGMQKRQALTLGELLVACLAAPFLAKSSMMIPPEWPLVPLFKAVAVTCPILIATPPY